MSSLCALYSFRLNLEHGTPDEIMAFCNEWFKFWAFQLEEGDSGYKHYQGEGSLRKKRRQHEIVNAMRKQGSIVPEYIQPIPAEQAVTIKNVHHLKQRYANKTDTRINGPFFSTTCDDYIPPQYANKELHGWQAKALAIAQEECRTLSDRHVHWIFDPTGSHGKSVLASLVELHKHGIDLPSCNDYTKLCEALCDELMDTNNRSPGMLLIDLPRAIPKNAMHGFISACEQFKKGKVVDGRNHYRKWWFATPSVWVFSNSLPPMKGLSRDRWIIWTFDKAGIDAELIPYTGTLNDEDL